MLKPSQISPDVRSPLIFLMSVSFINWLGFAAWQALLNNFVVEKGGFQWAEIGLTQSVREVPGLLAFTALFWIARMREQTLAYVSLLILAAGIAITGFFTSLTGVLATTFLMSIGFHYFETMNSSLQLQMLPKKEAPQLMSWVTTAGAAAQFVAYGALALAWHFGFHDYKRIYLLLGVICLALTAMAMNTFGKFDGPVAQNKSIVLRPRYWLYYAMTFMSGARRQLFHAFAGFLLVKSFGFTLKDTALMFLITAALTTLCAGQLGRLIQMLGERRTIMLENVVLICVFMGYALTTSGRIAGALFIIDGVFFTLMLAQRTYFQKIGDAADMASTASVAFTINHIAAVAIPVLFGTLGMIDPSLIFWLGVLIACISLLLSFLVPHDPGPGNETVLSGRETVPLPGRLAPAQ